MKILIKKLSKLPIEAWVGIIMGILILGVSICGIIQTSAQTRQKELKRQTNYSMPVEYIRGQHIKTMIRNMKHSKFAGDAEVGLTGGGELLKEMRKMAEKLFPEGEYILNKRYQRIEIKGYEYRGKVGWSENVYIKIK